MELFLFDQAKKLKKYILLTKSDFYPICKMVKHNNTTICFTDA